MSKTSKTEPGKRNYIKEFFYSRFHKIADNIKTLHQNLKKTTEEDLQQARVNRNSYQVFLDWLFDIFQYGFILSLPLNFIIGWQGWKNIIIMFMLGSLRWFVLDTIQKIKGIFD